MSTEAPYHGRAHVEIADFNNIPMTIVDSTLAHPDGIRIIVDEEVGPLLTAESATKLAGVLDRFLGTGSVAPEKPGGRRALVAGLVRLHDTVTGDSAEDAAIRYAIGCALDVAAGLKGGSEPLDDPGLATFGEPARRHTVWILRYLDAEVGDMHWDAQTHGEIGAETMARAAYAAAIGNWNCTLYRTATLVPEGLQRTRMRELLGEAVAKASEISRYGVSPVAAKILKAMGGDDRGMGPVVAACRASIDRTLREQQRKLSEAEDMVQLHQRCAARSTGDDRLSSEERLNDLAHEVPAIRSRISRVEEAKRGMKKDPESQFLPIGTVVSTSTIQESSISPLPVAGSKGVVVGYNTQSDRCILVAMEHGTRTVDGGTYEMYDPDAAEEDCEYRPAKFNFRRDELTVVSPGRLVGRDENDLVGFRPTHVDHEDDDEPNMLVEAHGFVWRIMLINDVPECTQIARSTAYFEEWLTRITQSS